MEPSLILFDIDGTLVDTAGAGRRAMERAFHEVFNVDGIARKAAGVAFAGMTDWGIFDALAGAAEIEDSHYRDRRQTVEDAYLGALSREMERPDPRRRIIPGIEPLLEELEARQGVYLGLLTGNLRAGARIKLEPFGLNRYFSDGGFGSDHPDRREVARVARRRLVQATGVEFDDARVVVVGDTDQDVDCAKANRFRSVAVESGWGSHESLVAARPDALLEDLCDLPRALLALGVERGRGDQLS